MKVCVVFRDDTSVVLNHVPSPKLQFHEVGELVEVSLTLTESGAVPDVTLEVKLATGASNPVTVIYSIFRVLLYPPVLNACNVTLYFPAVV